MSSVGEREKEKGDIRPRTREVGASKITHVIHSAACTLGSRVATHTYIKPLGTVFCQERLPLVSLLVVVVVKYGDVVMRVAEEMLLVCVRCVIDGWIWVCQCLTDVACHVNGAGVDVVTGVVICDVWNVVWWICGVICDVSNVGL